MTPDQAKASYRRLANEFIFIRRYTGSGTSRPKVDVQARARVVGYEPHELIGGIVQGDRRIIILAEDLIAKGFALPATWTANDKVVVRGKELAIMAADDSTRRVNGDLIAIEIQARG